MTNIDNIPFGLVNGAGDINYLNSVEGENLTTGTFARLNPTKIIATIENLDHFSISEIVTNPTRGDTLSTLSREEQIDIVVDSMSFITKQMTKSNPTTNFCNQITDRAAEEEGYAIENCLEEYLTERRYLRTGEDENSLASSS